MKIRASVDSLSFVFPYPPEDKKKKKMKSWWGILDEEKPTIPLLS